MAQAITHRGPDDQGIWFDAAAGVGMTNRRLAIIDLTADGHQPMQSSSGRYTVAYNGEIYNFAELRRELEQLNGAQFTFRGHSDTEVLLAAVEQWGLEGALERFVGMFAIALWDARTQTLHLVRDRLGEKPLYYGWIGTAFLFGSELKSLRTYPGFSADIDRNAIALFLRYNCIPDPFSIYSNVKKLEPGSILSFAVRQPRSGTNPSVTRYWSAHDMAERGATDRFAGTDQEAIDELERLLGAAIRQQMLASDVPVGAFLSGGIDSATIVALMQAQSQRPIKSFTIGVHDHHYNEAVHAARVASHLGSDHTELYVTANEVMAVIPRLPTLYDEPFADASQIPMFLVAQLAKLDVSVTLSGDGGDELFGGYNRHVWAATGMGVTEHLPRAARRAIARGLLAISPYQWERLFTYLAPVLPKKLRLPTPGDHIHKLANLLSVDDPGSAYRYFVTHWQDPEEIVIGASEPFTLALDASAWPKLDDLASRMMYLDLVGYLPNDILVKVDRASMGVSLESRVPLLDHRVVEFAWRLPLSMKIREGQSKWILRQVLYRHVPRALIERPKAGFGLPLGAWLRGPLREWAEALLAENRLRQEGFFNPAPIRAAWSEHLSGHRNRQYPLWDVLMFQAWLEAQSTAPAIPAPATRLVTPGRQG